MQTAEFIEASQAFVQRLDDTIYDTLVNSGRWMDFSSILETVKREVGIVVDDKDSSNYVYSLPVRAHLRQLVAEGRVVERSTPGSFDQPRHLFSIRQN